MRKRSATTGLVTVLRMNRGNGGAGLSRATRSQLASLARAHADDLRQGGADLDLGEIETFIRERVEAAVGNPDQVEPEVAITTEMVFQ
jgi:hypothetical protein